jgi:two-component system response regulator GlrR
MHPDAWTTMSEIAASPLKCIVSSTAQDPALALALCDAIARAERAGLDVEWRAGTLPCEDCDVLVPVVAAANVAQVTADLPAWHRLHRQCVVLPVVDGLSLPQLLGLLAAGAFDFATLPLDESALHARLRRAVGALPAVPLLQHQTHQVHAPALRELVGSSPAFVKQITLLPTIAGCDAGLLILGETGTGKEAYARAVHYLSPRAARPMVAVNCGAIPAELLESELFGHLRGAFTSANTSRAGLVREAEGGTLFLDEVDSLPLPAQAKLLRFLQEMEYRPVGGDAVQKADVRVIAACNQDLPGLVERGQFRRDLFFRLHVLTVHLPPLRERAEDVCTLAVRFLEQFARQARRAPVGLSPQAVKRLLAHDWPGNVRELKHVIERAVLMSPGPTIQVDDLQLPQAASQDDDGAESFHDAKARMVGAFERSYLERLLTASGGNITRAAEVAQKNRRALFELIRKHGVDAESFRA